MVYSRNDEVKIVLLRVLCYPEPGRKGEEGWYGGLDTARAPMSGSVPSYSTSSSHHPHLSSLFCACLSIITGHTCHRQRTGRMPRRTCPCNYRPSDTPVSSRLCQHETWPGDGVPYERRVRSVGESIIDTVGDFARTGLTRGPHGTDTHAREQCLHVISSPARTQS